MRERRVGKEFTNDTDDTTRTNHDIDNSGTHPQITRLIMIQKRVLEEKYWKKKKNY